MATVEELEKTIGQAVQRIDELESRAALRDLVSDYCIGFDTHDWDRFISIWHMDAVWEIGPPFGTFTGHEGISEAVNDVLYPAWRETHHLTTNLRLTFIDANHVQGISDVDCMGATPDNVVQMVGATYTDDFERKDSIWKISRRQVKIHYFNPIEGVKMSPP